MWLLFAYVHVCVCTTTSCITPQLTDTVCSVPGTQMLSEVTPNAPVIRFTAVESPIVKRLTKPRCTLITQGGALEATTLAFVLNGEI